jgi:hypothetical protein
MHGSLKTSGRFLTDIWEIAPVPSIQNIPAPIPPTGKAILERYSPEYEPLYECPSFTKICSFCEHDITGMIKMIPIR